MQNALRDFQKKNTIWKFMKIDHFLGQFPTRNSKIWPIKIISWQSAWKNEEYVHLRFLIFETSSQRFLQNMLRDFQKSCNYEKYKNCPFSRPYFYQKHQDMANKNHLMTISIKKWRKCISQILDFWNLSREILAKQVRRFSKIMILRKIRKVPII